MTKTFSVPVKRASMTGRNGHFDLTSIKITSYTDHDVSIDGVGKRGSVLNGGFWRITKDEMSQLARLWIQEIGGFTVEVTEEDFKRIGQEMPSEEDLELVLAYMENNFQENYFQTLLKEAYGDMLLTHIVEKAAREFKEIWDEG